MAVHLAVNAEWATVVCQPHITPLHTLNSQAAAAWTSARDVMRYTTLGITQMLTHHDPGQL
ncbi:hypothetical protein SMC26_08175 [Actinomadura fulvescens]|uniref:Uncharacterized protein n=1 Tax=Actinomadura fulvescens TaxID=46160 RepID=A0ABN3QWR5_9ACTN